MMDYIRNGNLYDYLTKFNEKTIKSVANQLAKVLKYLALKNIHCEFKLKHILVNY